MSSHTQVPGMIEPFEIDDRYYKKSRATRRRVGYVAKGEKMEWISVEDRLPKPYRAVLTCNAKGICQDERDPLVGAWQNEGEMFWFRVWCPKPGQRLTPTHWMPLPEPPA